MSTGPGEVISMQLTFQYSDGEKKTISIPGDEARNIAAVIFQEAVYEKIKKGAFDGAIPESLYIDAETGTRFVDKQQKNSMVIIYKSGDVYGTCDQSHPKNWL